MPQLVDLHIHSTYSDGLFPPVELVAMAKQRGLKAIAIADHDSVSGVDEAIEAGKLLGVEVIPAVELSVEFPGYHDIHILGYCINYRDPAFNRLLSEFRERRDSRGKAIILKINETLAKSGATPIDPAEAQELAGEAFGRPHIARLLVSKGYAKDNEDAFKRFLEPCNVPKKYFPVRDAIAEIRLIGGVAVLAHPTSITTDRGILRNLIFQFKEMGLDGLEAYNNMCNDDDMMFLESIARVDGLLLSGGSDYHGDQTDIKLGSGRGGLAVGFHLAEEIIRLAASRHNKFSA